MTGFAAISHYNGWMMAVLGAGIVFSGLAVLSFVVSQLPRLIQFIEYLDRMRASKKSGKPDAEAADGPSIPDHCPADIHEVARFYEPIIAQLGDSFHLVELYKLSRKQNFPHPHLTISSLRQAQILVPEGEDIFRWNHQLVKSND